MLGICSVFSGIEIAGQANRMFRIILSIFQNEVNRQQFPLLLIFSITLYNPCRAEHLYKGPLSHYREYRFTKQFHCLLTIPH